MAVKPRLERVNIYRTGAGYARMMEWYRLALARMTVPYETHYMPTRYGDTHLISAGSRDTIAPQIVLLHGINVNASVWRPQIEFLASFARVIAPDVPGFAGKSAPVRIPYTGRAYADWLADVLDELNVAHAVLVGSSAGGHFALKLAAYAPERVERLLLLNPCGLTPYRSFYNLMRLPPVVWAVRTLASRFLSSPQAARWLVERGIAPHLRASQENVELARLLLADYRRHHGPGPLPEDELRQVTAPVLLLMSDYELYHHPQHVIERAGEVFPNLLGAGMVPAAGHDINKDQPDVVNGAIMRLLNEAVSAPVTPARPLPLPVPALV